MKVLFIFLIVISFYSSINAQTLKGEVVEGLVMKSDMLKKDIPYSVYLPPDYNTSARSYPVVYLLHGYSDDETAWVQFGEVNETVDRGIASREIPPMIIVMPDAEISWYINDYKNTLPFEDMIFTEFIPFIDKTYNTRASKEFRAVAGLSMGGYGSLIWSLHHPEMFSSCVAFSAGIFTDQELISMPENDFNRFYKNIYGSEKDGNRLSEHWKNNSVISLINTLPKADIETVRFYIDCGDDDFLYKGNSSLHIAMRDREINHEYRVRDGSHNWSYWRNHIGEGLKFIGTGFHR
jgi:enterochelin esterase-like enzyme